METFFKMYIWENFYWQATKSARGGLKVTLANLGVYLYQNSCRNFLATSAHILLVPTPDANGKFLNHVICIELSLF